VTGQALPEETGPDETEPEEAGSEETGPDETGPDETGAVEPDPGDEAKRESLGIEASEATRTFVDAVIWGDHQAVWDHLATEGRETVLRVALHHGMDEALADRLRDGTATASERNDFLVDLVYGLRNDLHGTDLDALEYELDPEPLSPGQARVVLVAPMPVELGGGLPVGSAELSHDGERWMVERLIPRRSLSG